MIVTTPSDLLRGRIRCEMHGEEGSSQLYHTYDGLLPSDKCFDGILLRGRIEVYVRFECADELCEVRNLLVWWWYHTGVAVGFVFRIFPHTSRQRFCRFGIEIHLLKIRLFCFQYHTLVRCPAIGCATTGMYGTLPCIIHTIITIS